MEKKLFIPEDSDFSESFGVFDDSLPDGWGLTDRYLKSIGMEPSSVNQLTRLSMLADMFSLKESVRDEILRNIKASLSSL